MTPGEFLTLVTICFSRSIRDLHFLAYEVLPILYQTREPEFSFLAYRILEESVVSILSTGETLDLSQALIATGVSLEGKEIPFNPRKAEDALAWAGVFSLKGLSRREKERAIAIVDERWGEDWKRHCVVPWGPGASKSDMLDLEWVKPFGQNASFVCPDRQRRCDRGIFGTKTLPLVLYEQSNEMNLFGSFNPQLIVTYCRRCGAVGIANQCD